MQPSNNFISPQNMDVRNISASCISFLKFSHSPIQMNGGESTPEAPHLDDLKRSSINQNEFLCSH